MGSCVSKSNSRRKTTIESAKTFEWTKNSGFIDKFTFIQKIDSKKYEEVQVYLLSNCYEFEFAKYTKQVIGYNHEFVDEFKKHLKK
jgi:hypothetical protein